MKKFIILLSLFIVPLIFYIFLASGNNHFLKLPVLTKNVENVTELKTANGKSLTLKNKITVLCFLGDDLLHKKTNALNLNEEIYKHFYQFKHFQFIVILPKGTENKALILKNELGVTTDISKWNFIFGDSAQIISIFKSLKTPYFLNKNLYSPYAFIIDKKLDLRGRDDDKDESNGKLFGYNAETVAPIHKKMVDDIKIILAEYRKAYKKDKNK